MIRRCRELWIAGRELWGRESAIPAFPRRSAIAGAVLYGVGILFFWAVIVWGLFRTWEATIGALFEAQPTSVANQFKVILEQSRWGLVIAMAGIGLAAGAVMFWTASRFFLWVRQRMQEAVHVENSLRYQPLPDKMGTTTSRVDYRPGKVRTRASGRLDPGTQARLLFEGTQTITAEEQKAFVSTDDSGEKRRMLVQIADAMLELERADYLEFGPSYAADALTVDLSGVSSNHTRLGESDRAVLARRIENGKQRRVALYSAISQLCQLGDIGKAHEIARRLPVGKNLGLSKVGAAYALVSKTEQAMQVAGELEGLCRTSALAEIAAALAAVRQFAFAQQLLDRALEAAHHEKPDTWRARETLTIIPVLCTIGKADEASNLLDVVMALAATIERSGKIELEKQIEECRTKIQLLSRV